MRHRKKKKILGRKKDPRRILIKNLAKDLILRSRLKTSPAKAKVLKSRLEKMITKSKKNDLAAKRYLEKRLDKKSAAWLLSEITPRYKERPGGYTRIIKLKNRVGDNSPQVLIEFV